jgi:hypothetical protein
LIPLLRLLKELPGLHRLLTWLSVSVSTFLASTFGNVAILLSTAVTSILVWVLTIGATFFILEYLLNRQIVGLKTTITDTEKVDFLTAKAKDTDLKIIPSSTFDIQKIETELIQEKAVEARLKQQQQLQGSYSSWAYQSLPAIKK